MTMIMAYGILYFPPPRHLPHIIERVTRFRVRTEASLQTLLYLLPEEQRGRKQLLIILVLVIRIQKSYQATRCRFGTQLV